MIKKLAGCIREYKRQTILTPILVAVEVVMDVLIPFVMSILLNEIETGGNITNVLLLGVLLIALALIALYFGAMSGKMGAQASAGFAKNLRHDMYYSIQDY